MKIPNEGSNVHLICGALGAGKTTYSDALAQQEHAFVLSIDDWMARLFGPDISGTPQWLWITERVARCETQIINTAIGACRVGANVVLDIGLLRIDSRRAVADLLRTHGVNVALHVLDVDVHERWRRVSARNTTRGETFRLEVTRPMFDFIETLWQRPDDAELQALNGRRVAQATI